MTTNNAPIVGIFNERGSAERAIEDLYNAGIPSDQISYSGGGTPSTSGGGFLESIKSLFSVGHDRTSVDVLNDLNTMGIPQDEAEYYAQQYDAGRTIVAIQQDTMNHDALTILRSNGGYDYQGNWNRASADKFAGSTNNATTADSTYDPQNLNQQTTPVRDQAANVNQVNESPASNRSFTGTEAGTYNQDTTSPAFTSQRRYTDTTNQEVANSDTAYPRNSTSTYNQNINTPNNAGQQNYTDATDIADAPTSVNRQTFIDPNAQNFNASNPAGQQAYIASNQQSSGDPNQQAHNNPNQQGFNNPNNPGQRAYVNSNQQGFNNPNNPGQQAYADPNQQGFNNPNNPGQQTYTNPASYNQTANNPAYANQQAYNDPNQLPNTYNQDVNNPYQQAYADPNQQAFNNPNATNAQAYTDTTQSANTYNQGSNAAQNQQENPNAQRIRTERDGINGNPDQNYEREQRNATDQNNR